MVGKIKNPFFGLSFRNDLKRALLFFLWKVESEPLKNAVWLHSRNDVVERGGVDIWKAFTFCSLVCVGFCKNLTAIFIRPSYRELTTRLFTMLPCRICMLFFVSTVEDWLEPTEPLIMDFSTSHL